MATRRYLRASARGGGTKRDGRRRAGRHARGGHAAGVDAAGQPGLQYAECDVIERIGSPSASGVVLRCLAPTGRMVAVKVFVPPPGSAEVAVAIAVGAAARRDLDLPFPMTYGTGAMTSGALAALAGRGLLPAALNRQGAVYLISEFAAGDLWQVAAEAAAAGGGAVSEWARSRMPLLFPHGVTTAQAWRAEVAFHAFCCMRKLHDVGVAHGDIHPGNMLVLRSGKVVIHDFGAAAPLTPGRAAYDYSKYAQAFHGWGVPPSVARGGFADLCA